MNEKRRARISVEAIIAIVAVIVGAILWQFRLRFPFDDTFISFRYADHLYSGLGLVWNAGGPHTEGYTNFLYVLLLALSRVFTRDLLLVSQWIGIACVALTSVAVYRIGRSWSQFVGILAAVLYLVTPLVWINALSGMETSLFILCIVWAIEASFADRPASAYAWCFFAMLTRPEGAFLAMIFLVASYPRSGFKRNVRVFLLAFVAPTLVYVAWKYFYFGQLLPNSFYVKVLATSSALPGLQYVRLFVSSVLVLVVALTPLMFRRVDSRSLSLFLWASFLILFYLFVRPLEGLYDRFLIPALPALVILASAGVYRFSTVRKRPLTVFAILLVTLHVGLSVLSPRTKQSLQAHEDLWDRSLEPMIAAIGRLPHSDSLLIGYGDAGYVAYRTGMRHLDLFGLNDSRIARAKTVAEKQAVVLSERPDILMLPAILRDSCWKLDENAYGAARDSNYVAAAMMQLFPSPIVFLVDRRGPNADSLIQAFRLETASIGSGLQPPPDCLDRN